MSKVIGGDKYRITVLTDRLLRFEYSDEGRFEDGATKTVINREFADVDSYVRRENGLLIIETAELLVKYDEKPFTSNGLSVSTVILYLSPPITLLIMSSPFSQL